MESSDIHKTLFQTPKEHGESDEEKLAGPHVISAYRNHLLASRIKLKKLEERNREMEEELKTLRQRNTLASETPPDSPDNDSDETADKDEDSGLWFL